MLTIGDGNPQLFNIADSDNLKYFEIFLSMLGFMRILQEFKDFLDEYKVMGLATAFIIGVAATVFIQALVNDIIMPLITPFIPGGEWQAAKFALGPVVISWGHFLGAVINFVVIAFVVFMIAKLVLNEEKVTKK